MDTSRLNKIRYGKSEIDRAGETLKKDPNNQQALAVLGNWRSVHNYPLNTFQATLRTRLKEIDADAIVAQRLKRTPSIIAKLKRFESMKLARMQDIGGLRAIVWSLPKLRKLHRVYRKVAFKHNLVRENDYVLNPKSSGYRGIHLVYKYQNRLVPEYDGLQIELQLRTRLQHAWATAVETIGTFIDQPLKASIGPDKWLTYFTLVSSAFALIERSPPVAAHTRWKQTSLVKKIRSLTKELQMFNVLEMYNSFIQHSEARGKGKTYYLVELDLKNKRVLYSSYARDQLEAATAAYSNAEARFPDEETGQVVLVSAESVKALRRAYPNYFLDTSVFAGHIRRILRMK